MDYEDIAQELRIEIFKSLKHYNSSKSKLSTFVGKVAKKKGVDLLRYKLAKKRSTDKGIISLDDILEKLELGKAQNLSEFFVYTEEYNDIDSILSCLSDRNLEVCKLLIPDYNISEITKIKKRNRRTIIKQVQQIREVFRNL